MATVTYDDALRRLLVHEGGYSNHPSDPGGPTNFGITIADYRKYVKPDATAADVRAMPLAHAKAIYREKYWGALRCDELPAGLDYAMFDYGVNSGTSRAAKVLRRLLGLPDSGGMSDAVIDAVKQDAPGNLIARLCDERLAFLKSLRTWPVFGAGWGRRVAEVRRAALVFANGARDNTTTSKAQGRGAVPVAKTARGATTAGVVIAGGAAAQVAHQAGAGWLSVMACVVATAMVALAGWIFWRWRQTRKQDAAIVGEGADNGTWAALCRTFKGWKTVAFGSLVALFGLAVDILDALQAVDISPLLPPAYAVKIIAAIGVATIVLRFATTGRIGQKDH